MHYELTENNVVTNSKSAILSQNMTFDYFSGSSSDESFAIDLDRDLESEKGDNVAFHSTNNSV